MRILIATDAWHPQVNGVVRTLTMMAEAAKSLGVEVVFLEVRPSNTAAIALYQRFGFVEHGVATDSRRGMRMVLVRKEVAAGCAS